MDENFTGQQGWFPDEPKKKKPYLKYFLFILIPLLLIGAAILPWYFLQKQGQEVNLDNILSLVLFRSPKPSIPTIQPIPAPLVWRSATEMIKEGKLPSPQQTLEVFLSYNKNSIPNLKISSAEIKSGYPSPSKDNRSYNLKLVDNNKKVLSQTAFSVPNKIVSVAKDGSSQQ